MNRYLKAILSSKHFGVPKPIRKMVLAPFKRDLEFYTYAHRKLSGYERRLGYAVADAAEQIKRVSAGATNPCFVDCGFNAGVVLAKFRNQLPNFKFYGYEPQPDLFASVCQKFPDLKLKHAALSVDDGTAKLFVAKNLTYDIRGGSTILADHHDPASHTETIDVPCLNFSREIDDIRREHDFIAVKMDVEGAEYDILEHLLSRPGKPIDFLIIEFHPKLTTPERHSDTVSCINERSIPVINWY